MPGRYWNFAFGAAFVLLHRPFPMRGIPALQVDVPEPGPPSGLSFAHHFRPNRAVNSKLAGQAGALIGVCWAASCRIKQPCGNSV